MRTDAEGPSTPQEKPSTNMAKDEIIKSTLSSSRLWASFSSSFLCMKEYQIWQISFKDFWLPESMPLLKAYKFCQNSLCSSTWRRMFHLISAKCPDSFLPIWRRRYFKCVLAHHTYDGTKEVVALRGRTSQKTCRSTEKDRLRSALWTSSLATMRETLYHYQDRSASFKDGNLPKLRH